MKKRVNKKKQFFIPVTFENIEGSNERIGVNIKLIEVSEEVYRAYYQPVWKARYHARKRDECGSPKSEAWKCDGVCSGCEFYTPRETVSIETPIGDEDSGITIGDTLTDSAPLPETTVIESEKKRALYGELSRLSPEDKFLCKCVSATRSERQSAKLAGIPRSTFRRRWEKIKIDLREKLKDYYL